MLIATTAAVLAVVLHTAAALLAARENYGRTLPTMSGSYPVRPARRVRRAQTVGWILSLVSAVQFGNIYWLSQPWLSVAIAIAVLLFVNGAPSLIVSLAHNYRLSTGADPDVPPLR